MFICNADQEKAVQVDVSVAHRKHISFWDLQGGTQVQIPTQTTNFIYDMPPCGSILLTISDTAIANAEPPVIRSAGMTEQRNHFPGSDTSVTRLDPNVLTLDYVDVKVGDEERKDIYTYPADRWIWQKNGFGKNPFDNEVQFKDELITKTFPAASGFSATYRFMLDGFTVLPKPLYIVLERPDLYKVSCNGKPLATPEHTGGQTPQFKEWSLDKSFGKIDISEAVKNGENEITITSSPLTVWTALEPAYLLGDFSLQSADKGFVVCPPMPLTMNGDDIPLKIRHSDGLERISWLSAGVGFRPNRPDLVDRSPTLIFEFAEPQPIAAIRIWNYCERNLQKRSVKEVEITGIGKVELPMGDGFAKDILTGVLSQPMPPIKTVEFKILSNHAGTTYPIPENARPDDNGFVGLAEVQFLVRDGDELVPVKNVKVTASSELVVESHDRRARYLVDGSGLGRDTVEPGWHRQGMPFYAGKVEYSRTFNVERTDGKFYVKLPVSPTGWYGATARVFVNGNDAGFVMGATWQSDVTKFIKQGKNEISVQVYGTPKNLLGPHHAGRLRGSAWPGSFHQAPANQPAGSAYDTIGYGMFEPFELIQWGNDH